MCIQRYLYFGLAVVLAFSLSACDYGDQNFDFESGNSLTVSGTDSLSVPDTASYVVQAFTIEKDYSWTASGSAEILQTRRDGEFIDVAFTEPGMYTIEVDDGEYTGSIEVEATEPEE